MIKEDGRYQARAVEVVLGKSKTKKTPSISVTFRVEDGPSKGDFIRWDGWLTERTAERTFEALQYCGWTGDRPSDFASGALCGIDKNVVELVVEMEPYDGNDPKYQGKSYPMVQWVNRPGGGARFSGTTANKAEAADFDAKFRGLALAAKAKAGVVASPAPRPITPADLDSFSDADEDAPF